MIAEIGTARKHKKAPPSKGGLPRSTKQKGSLVQRELARLSRDWGIVILSFCRNYKSAVCVRQFLRLALRQATSFCTKEA